MKYSLASLLAAATIACLAIALWLESSKEPEILYLHLYSNRYDIHSMSSDLPKPPREWQCIATLSISPGVEIYANLPNHYEPEMLITGHIHRSGNGIETNLEFDLQDVGFANSYHQKTPLEAGEVVSFWGEFQMCISQEKEPPLLEEKSGETSSKAR